jgi:hypothetical protein
VLGRTSKTKWIVPVVVALIAAIGGVVAAVIPSLLGSHGVTEQATPPAYHGMATLREDNPEVDLDTLPDGTGGDHVPDLVHEVGALTTSKDSLIALLDRTQQPTPEICRPALAAHGTQSVPVSQLESGLSFCIRTSAGHLGAVTLDFVRKYTPKRQPPRTGPAGSERLGEVAISYRIWDVPAS